MPLDFASDPSEFPYILYICVQLPKNYPDNGLCLYPIYAGICITVYPEKDIEILSASAARRLPDL